jgi:hypothetical protein
MASNKYLKQCQFLSQIFLRQRNALTMALWIREIPIDEDTILTRRLKQLLLRAFVIYQRRKELSPDKLQKYHSDFKRRLKQYLVLQPESKKTTIPYYLFAFLAEISSANNQIKCEPTLEVKQIPQKSESVASPTQNNVFLSWYYKVWLALVWKFLAITTKNPHIVRLKDALGCISLIPIKIKKQHIRVRGVCIHYHDLYHLEVSQLERIQMGKHWVSGIHGLNAKVFHDQPIVLEYNGFLDEARIAIHEALTRPTPFSLLKVICWMTLLFLHGINPLAVLIRHLESMRNKQAELMQIIYSKPI